MDIPNIIEQKKRRIYDLLNHFNFSEQSKLKIKELIEKVSTEELEYELKTKDFHNIYERVWESSMEKINNIEDQNVKKETQVFLEKIKQIL